MQETPRLVPTGRGIHIYIEKVEHSSKEGTGYCMCSNYSGETEMQVAAVLNGTSTAMKEACTFGVGHPSL